MNEDETPSERAQIVFDWFEHCSSKVTDASGNLIGYMVTASDWWAIRTQISHALVVPSPVPDDRDNGRDRR